MPSAGLLTLTMAEPILSTVNGVLGPAAGAVLPARSVAVPAASEMPSVPLPVRIVSVTVRVVPVPVTPIEAVTVPVAFTVMSPAESVLALKFASAYVTVYVTDPEATMVADGAPMETVGGVLSTVNVAPLVGAAVITFPARSVPVLKAIVAVPLPAPTTYDPL